MITTAPAPPAAISVSAPASTPVGYSNVFNPMVSWVAMSGPTGTLRFGFSKGGNLIVPGDTWAAQITGAQPNAPVTVVSKLNGTTSAAVPVGTTDSNGTFQITGLADSSSVGQWSRTFFVGDGILGTFNYMVMAGMSGLGRVYRGGWAA